MSTDHRGGPGATDDRWSSRFVVAVTTLLVVAAAVGGIVLAPAPRPTEASAPLQAPEPDAGSADRALALADNVGTDGTPLVIALALAGMAAVLLLVRRDGADYARP